MGLVIHTENLSKRYRSVTAVDGLSLSVNKGEIYGFLGLNGAGKTTTIRMLLGMISPSSGQAVLNGQKASAGNHALWQRVGYFVEIPYAYPELTVKENLDIVRRLRFLECKSIDEVMEKLHLTRYADRPAKTLSLGNSQRLGLAKAIIHHPEILILDEPANGLDPAGIVEIRNLMLDLSNQHGVTIFLSSHILGEIAKFATRIGIIHEGRLLQEACIHELEKNRQRKLLINLTQADRGKQVLRQKGFVVESVVNGTLHVSGADAINHPEKINTLLVQAGFAPSMIKVEEEDLESYFLRIIAQTGVAS